MWQNGGILTRVCSEVSFADVILSGGKSTLHPPLPITTISCFNPQLARSNPILLLDLLSLICRCFVLYSQLMRLLIAFLLYTLALAQLLLGAGEYVEISCTSAGHVIYFKTMREFSVVSLNRVDGVTLTSDKAKCSFRGSSSSICTFENFTKELNITCQSNNNEVLHFFIEKPNIMDDTEEKNSTFVLISLS